MDTMIKSDNPLASLLRQALDLTENTTGIPVDIDYEAISRAAIKAAREERTGYSRIPKVLVTQNEAHNIYGKSVITALLRRGKLQPYKFDMTEAYDKSGDLVKKGQGGGLLPGGRDRQRHRGGERPQGNPEDRYKGNNISQFDMDMNTISQNTILGLLLAGTVVAFCMAAREDYNMDVLDTIPTRL